MTVVRAPPASSVQSDVAGSVINRYDDWLTRRLNSPVTLPTLQIFNAGQYYQTLDRQVLRCLHGEAPPQEALGEVARQWQAITESVGIEKQLRAWRRAQGMRA